MTTSKPKDIAEYIARFPLEVQEILEGIRVTIKKVVPARRQSVSGKFKTTNIGSKEVL